MAVDGGREGGWPHVFWVKYKLYHTAPVYSERDFLKKHHCCLMPFFWSAMEIHLPADGVSVENFLGLGMWGLGKALVLTAKDVKPELLVWFLLICLVSSSTSLPLLSVFQPFLSRSSCSCFKDLFQGPLLSAWKANSFPS